VAASQTDQALEHYKEAVRLGPDFVDARIALGKVLTSLGRPEEALQQQSEAVRLDPQNEAAHYRLAQAYRKLGRTEDSEHEFAILESCATPVYRYAHCFNRFRGSLVAPDDCPQRTAIAVQVRNDDEEKKYSCDASLN